MFACWACKNTGPKLKFRFGPLKSDSQGDQFRTVSYVIVTNSPVCVGIHEGKPDEIDRARGGKGEAEAEAETHEVHQGERWRERT